MGHRQSDALAAWQEWNDARDHKRAEAFARRIDALETNPMSERDIEQLDGSNGPAAHHIDTCPCDGFDWNGSDEV